MTFEEHHDILQILTTQSWQARMKMLEYMKTVKVEEEERSMTEQEVKEFETPLELDPVPEPPKEEPWKEVQEQYLSGKPKPPYPEYDGPPTF